LNCALTSAGLVDEVGLQRLVAHAVLVRDPVLEQVLELGEAGLLGRGRGVVAVAQRHLGTGLEVAELAGLRELQQRLARGALLGRLERHLARRLAAAQEARRLGDVVETARRSAAHHVVDADAHFSPALVELVHDDDARASVPAVHGPGAARAASADAVGVRPRRVVDDELRILAALAAAAGGRVRAVIGRAAAAAAGVRLRADASAVVPPMAPCGELPRREAPP
jgi:hypothetical protein